MLITDMRVNQKLICQLVNQKTCKDKLSLGKKGDSNNNGINVVTINEASAFQLSQSLIISLVSNMYIYITFAA